MRLDERVAQHALSGLSASLESRPCEGDGLNANSNLDSGNRSDVFYAHTWGQSVIRANYGGKSANFGFVEMILSF